MRRPNRLVSTRQSPDREACRQALVQKQRKGFKWLMRLPPGGQQPTLVVQVGQAHEGSLGSAYAQVDAAAGAGADVIKLQTHVASAESAQSEDWHVRLGRKDATRVD